jgi:phosphoribosylformylglycinamidine synthase
MSTRVGVVLFPGSNCEYDVVEAVHSLGGEARVIWHGDRSLAGVDAVILPGGFQAGRHRPVLSRDGIGGQVRR